MNTKKLKQINEIVNEAKAFKAKADGMEKECAAIKKYCLDALHDLRDTFCVVLDIIKKNPDIGRNSSTGRNFGNAWYENGSGFSYNDSTDYIDQVHVEPREHISGLVGRFTVTNRISRNLIDRAIEGVNKVRTDDIKYWTEMKRYADGTRHISEALLEGLRISAESLLEKNKKLMEDGIAAGSKKYEKVT